MADMAHGRLEANTAVLRWTARITCLSAAIGLYSLDDFTVSTLLLFLVPALVAWWAHLLGSILLLIVSCHPLYLHASAGHVLILLPLVVYIAGGVLHLTVWAKERIPSRDGSTRLSPALLWAAQLMPFTAVLLLMWIYGSVSIRDFDRVALIVLTPLIVAVFALQWHLLGGIAIIALSLVALGFSFRGGEWGVFFALLFLIPFSFGGMLHIVVWYSRRRIKTLHKRA